MGRLTLALRVVIAFNQQDFWYKYLHPNTTQRALLASENIQCRQVCSRQKQYIIEKRPLCPLKSFVEYQKVQQKPDKWMCYFLRKLNTTWIWPLILNTSLQKNPKQLWEELKFLGPKRIKKIQCYTIQREISSESIYVQNVWTFLTYTIISQ